MASSSCKSDGCANGSEQEHAFVLQRVPPAVVDFYQGIPNQVLEVCQSPTFLQKNHGW